MKILIILVFQCVCVTNAAKLSLETYLFTNYSNTRIPKTNFSDDNEVVEIEFDQLYLALQKVDERAGTIEVTLKTRLWWKDVYLMWNPQDFGGMDYFVTAATNIWSPDIGKV